MKGFESLWSSVARARNGEAVSPDLKPLLLRVYDHHASQSALRNSLVELLHYLRDRGRTNANCWATDLFFR